MQRAAEPLDLSAQLQQWMSKHQAQPADRALLTGKIWNMHVTALAISATEIRGQRGAGQSVQFLVPEPVLTVIDQLGLYPAKS